MSAILKLQSSEGKRFQISREAARHMGTIRHLIESLEDDENDTILPVPKVKSKILAPIIEWCEYHKAEEIYVPIEDVMKDGTGDIPDPYDKEFVNVPKDQLFDYILAANYLAIENLLELTCKAVSNLMKDKTSEELREYFELRENNQDMIHPNKRLKNEDDNN